MSNTDFCVITIYFIVTWGHIYITENYIIKEIKNALKSSDAQIQARKAPLGEQERTESQKSQTGDSNHDERKA